MASPKGPAVPYRKDWRAQMAEPGRASRGRGVKRALLSACLLVLVVLLVVLLLPPRLPTTYLVCLPVSDYEMTMPLVPYAMRNVEQLTNGLQGQAVEVSVWENLQTTQGLASLASRLEALDDRRRTTLIVYVTAHAVSDQGAAYLLCSDFQTRHNPEGRYKLSDLLEQLRKCRAKLKLLILDVATISPDVRLGMVVNEFPRLVETQLAKLPDPDLFVLMSHGPLQRAHAAHAARRSVFNYYLVEGLRGAANRTDPNDHVVDLEELFTYVRNRVAEWVARQTEERESQIPVLFRGGEGVCHHVPDGRILVRITAEPNRPEPAPADPNKAPQRPDSEQPETKTSKSVPPQQVEAGAKGAQQSPEPAVASAAQPGQAAQGNGSKGASEAGVGAGGGSSGLKPDPATGPQSAASPVPKPATSSTLPVPPTPEKPTVAQPPASQPPTSQPPGPQPPTPQLPGSQPLVPQPPGPASPNRPLTGDQPGQASQASQPGRTAEPAPSTGASPAKPEATPGAFQATPGSVVALLEQAWQVRDRMNTRTTPEAFLPVDYAPHLWRQYHELLLGFELRHRYGVPWSEERLKALADLAQGTTSSSALGAASILGRLETARQQFVQNAEIRQRFERLRAEGLHEIEAAIKLCNEVCFAAPYYVRWHGQLAPGSSAEMPLYRRIARLLDDEHLPRLMRLVESLEATGLASGPGRQVQLAQLRQVAQRVAELRTEIEEGAGGLMAVSRELLRSPKKRPADICLIESLLSLPLLSAPVRMGLLKRLEELSPSLDPQAGPEEPRRLEHTAARLRLWDRFAEHARLELRLARLADPEGLRPDDSPVWGAPAAARTEDDLWESHRKLGRQLAEFYQGFADRIIRARATPQVEDAQQASRLMRLVDARDVGGEWSEGLTAMAVRTPQLPPELRLQLAAPARLVLDRSAAWVPLDAVLKLSGAPCQEVRFRVGYDSRQLELLDRDRDRPLAAGVEMPITLDSAASEQTAALHVNIRPKGDLTWRRTVLDIRAAAQDKTAACQVEIELPAPDLVELQAERILDLASGARVPADWISRSAGSAERPTDRLCDAFPNRTTEYVLSAVNRSGRAKKVVVELWAPPLEAANPTEPFLGPLDRWGKPLPGYRKLASSAEFDLDAAGTPQPIPFAQAKPKSDKEPDQPAKTAAQPAKPDVPADAPLVSRGLACVIYDTTTKQPSKPPWVWWLQFELVAPRQYVQPTVRYDQGRITIELRPSEAKWLPRLSPQTPIRVDWEVGATLDPSTRMSTHAELTAPDQLRTLFAEAPPSPSREIPVQLTVDGYPRAFVYRVRTDRAREVEAERDLREVRILSPRPGEAFRIPSESPIGLRFQVDAPADAFRRWKDRPRDVVEVAMEVAGQRALGTQEKLLFYGDRQVEARLREIGEAGVVKIDTKVTDFQVPLRPGEMKNVEGNIRVTLNLAVREGAGSSRDIQSAAVRVILDGAPPEIKPVDAPRLPVPLGSDAPVTVELRDALSGVVRLEAGFDTDNSGDLEDKERLAEILPPNIQDRTRLSLATKELKPGKYAILVRAWDRVGWKALERIGFVQVVPPPPPPKPSEAPKPARSSIAGRVEPFSSDRRWIDLVVEIEGNAELKPSISPHGEFVFRDVPQGQYTLHARGIWGNVSRKGSAKVTVTDTPASVRIVTQPAGD